MPNPTTAAETGQTILLALRKSRPPHACRERDKRIPYPYLRCRACREEWLDAYARQQVEALETEIRRLRGERETLFNHPPLYRYDAESNKVELLECVNCAAHQAVVRELAEILDGIWLDPQDHPETVKRINGLLAHPLVVQARREGRG